MELIVLGLPLGNIEDISLRAIRVLSEAKLVICEDTRVFYKLWQKLVFLGHIDHNFTGDIVVINEFNEKEKLDNVIDKLNYWGGGVLVADAGLPTISDPGFRLVKQVLSNGGKTISVPGPTAVMTAASISGLSTDRLLFLGFLPKKKSKRQKLWDGINSLPWGVTVGIYESPKRAKATLMELGEKVQRVEEVVVARELTKQHEELIFGSIKEVVAQIDNVKGEVVLLVRIAASEQ